MSNAAITAAWKADVQPAARKLVLLFMADCLNDKTGQLNPSVDAVARACGMSADQARRHLHALIDAGLLSVVGNGNGGYHREASRRYKLHLDAVTPGADATPCTSATPCTDAADPLHGSREPLAPMQLTPGTHASQTRRNQNETGMNQNGRARPAPLSASPPSLEDVRAAFQRNEDGYLEADTEAPALFDCYQAIGWTRTNGQQTYSLDTLVSEWIRRKGRINAAAAR